MTSKNLKHVHFVQNYIPTKFHPLIYDKHKDMIPYAPCASLTPVSIGWYWFLVNFLVE